MYTVCFDICYAGFVVHALRAKPFVQGSVEPVIVPRLSIENKFRGYSPPPGKNLGGGAVKKNSPPPNLKI